MEIEYTVTVKNEAGEKEEAFRATATEDGDLSVEAPDDETLIAALDNMQEMIDFIRQKK